MTKDAENRLGRCQEIQTRDNNIENGLGKTTNFYFTIILGVTLHKENDRNVESNPSQKE